jgi:hypothetical protein
VRCRRSPFFVTTDLAELLDAVVDWPREIGVNEWADGRTLHKVDTAQQPRGTPEANGDRAAAAFFRFQRRDRVTLQAFAAKMAIYARSMPLAVLSPRVCRSRCRCGGVCDAAAAGRRVCRRSRA